MNAPLLERYHDRIAGVLTCYDRRVITGTLPGACHAAGMTGFLNVKGIRIFDYPRFAEPLRERVRANAEALAASAGITIQCILPRRTFARKPRLPRSSRHGAITLAWCMSSPSWRPARRTSPGTTSAPLRAGRLSFGQTDQPDGDCFNPRPTLTGRASSKQRTPLW